MLTTTVKTIFKDVPRLSVKSKEPLPKGCLFDIMSELDHLVITKHVKIGDIIVSNIHGTGVDMIATKSTYLEQPEGGLHEIHPID
jgi:CxxC motif-containing protein